LEWKYSEQNIGLKIFRPKHWPENIQTKTLARKYSDQNIDLKISRPKYWNGNIQTEILEWKYSEQNFGLKIFRPKQPDSLEIFLEIKVAPYSFDCTAHNCIQKTIILSSCKV
jgi:hypothetical protein